MSLMFNIDEAYQAERQNLSANRAMMKGGMDLELYGDLKSNNSLLREALAENMKALKTARIFHAKNWSSLTSVGLLLATYRTLKISHVESFMNELDEDCINHAIRACSDFEPGVQITSVGQLSALSNLVNRSEATLDAMNQALSEGIDLSGTVVNRLCTMIADETYVLAKLHQLMGAIHRQQLHSECI